MCRSLMAFQETSSLDSTSLQSAAHNHILKPASVRPLYYRTIQFTHAKVLQSNLTRIFYIILFYVRRHHFLVQNLVECAWAQYI